MPKLGPEDDAQIPAIFRNWAFLRHPRYANVGATALANAILDPIASGSLRLLAYVGDPKHKFAPGESMELSLLTGDSAYLIAAKNQYGTVTIKKPQTHACIGGLLTYRRSLRKYWRLPNRQSASSGSMRFSVVKAR